MSSKLNTKTGSFSMADFIELNTFNDIIFYEDTHKYFKTEAGKEDLPFISVTTFIKKFVPDFHENYWLTYKTLQGIGLNVESHSKADVPYEHIRVNGTMYYYDDLKIMKSDLKKEWTIKGDEGKTRGTDMHKIFEYAFVGKMNSVNKEIKDYVEQNRHLALLKSEFIVADYDAEIAGQLDALFFNTLTGEIELHDYKTDKEIKFNNKFQSMKAPIEFMSDCNFNKYTLQLNMYKHCIEKYTSLKIGKMKIIHVRDKIRPYDIPNSPDIIKLLL